MTEETKQQMEKFLISCDIKGKIGERMLNDLLYGVLQAERDRLVDSMKIYFKDKATEEQRLSFAAGKTFKDLIDIVQQTQ